CANPPAATSPYPQNPPPTPSLSPPTLRSTHPSHPSLSLPAAQALTWAYLTFITLVGLLYLPSADRKSTRLNSSHDQISYAVFCLKKKRVAGRGTNSRAPARTTSRMVCVSVAEAHTRIQAAGRAVCNT